MLGCEDDFRVLASYWSVGSFGAFPIEIVQSLDGFFVSPSDHESRGPFATVDAAVDAARMDFECTDGGFWDTAEEAAAHGMRSEGE